MRCWLTSFTFFQASLSELHSELQEQYLWWWNGPMSKMMFPACGWPVVLFLSRRHHSSLVWIVPCIYWNILTCCYHMKLLDGKNCFFFCCCYCCSWRRFWSCWLWNGSSTSMRGLSIHSVHFLWVLDLKVNCWFTQTHVIKVMSEETRLWWSGSTPGWPCHLLWNVITLVRVWSPA